MYRGDSEGEDVCGLYSGGLEQLTAASAFPPTPLNESRAINSQPAYTGASAISSYQLFPVLTCPSGISSSPLSNLAPPTSAVAERRPFADLTFSPPKTYQECMEAISMQVDRYLRRIQENITKSGSQESIPTTNQTMECLEDMWKEGKILNWPYVPETQVNNWNQVLENLNDPSDLEEDDDMNEILPAMPLPAPPQMQTPVPATVEPGIELSNLSGDTIDPRAVSNAIIKRSTTSTPGMISTGNSSLITYTRQNGRLLNCTQPPTCGSHVIKFEISDIRDLEGVDPKDFWRNYITKIHMVIRESSPAYRLVVETQKALLQQLSMENLCFSPVLKK